MRRGFSLIEVLLSLGGVGILVVIATSFLFSILSQRDQAVAESLVAEQAEGVFALVEAAVKSARSLTVEAAGSRLMTQGPDECLLFEWDEASQELKFGRELSSSCSDSITADQRLTSTTAAIETVSFSLASPDDSSRTVGMKMVVAATRPLWQSRQEFNQAFVNVVDEGGG